MANPQPDDAHLRIAHAIHEQIMMCEFSKRQRKVLDLILRLSWGCAKKYAVIPYLKDFQLVGVHASDITQELEYLVNARVITWDRDQNRFAFNKDYDQWRISIVRHYDDKRLKELVNANLQNTKTVGETPSQKGRQNAKPLGETPKTDLVKHQASRPSSPHSACGSGVSKEKLKERATTTTAKSPPPERDSDPEFAALEESAEVILGRKLQAQEYVWLTRALARASPDQIREAFEAAESRDVEIRGLRYFEPILTEIMARDTAREEALSQGVKQNGASEKARRTASTDTGRDYTAGWSDGVIIRAPAVARDGPETQAGS